jgi:YVTN family beta-propeller protein
MKLKQGILWVLLGLSSLFFIAGCGDTFRPIATPLPKPSPDPAESHTAVVIFKTAPGSIPGTLPAANSLQINVAGESVSGQVPLGVDPVYATISSSVLSVNNTDSSLSIYGTLFGNFSSTSTTPPAVTTISLPGDAAPVFAVQAGSGIYVAFFAHNTVGLVSTGNAFTGEVPVGTKPTALVALPNGSKVYSINQGSNDVTPVNTSDNTTGTPISVGATPVWGVVSPDGARVYVLNQGSNNVSVIDTGTDSVTATITVGTGPNYAIYDSHLNRVYVTNQNSNTLSVIDADSTSPNFNKNIAEIALQGTAPKSVTVLPDATKIYVANFGSGNVTVINTLSNQVIKTISVGGQPISIAASPDSTKVVVANQAGYVSVIRAATDAETTRVPGPKACDASGNNCATQQAVIAGVV